MISSSARLSRRYPMPPRTAVGNNRGRGARPLEREKANQALNATTTKAVRIADIVFEWRFHRLTDGKSVETPLENDVGDPYGLRGGCVKRLVRLLPLQWPGAPSSIITDGCSRRHRISPAKPGAARNHYIGQHKRYLDGRICCSTGAGSEPADWIWAQPFVGSAICRRRAARRGCCGSVDI